MPDLAYTPVESSNLEAIAYDPGSKTLGVRFRSGVEWHYGGVSQDDFDALMAAESIGAEFAGRIRANPGFKAARA